MSPLAMSYTLDLEPAYPTEEQAHEAYLHLSGGDPPSHYLDLEMSYEDFE